MNAIKKNLLTPITANRGFTLVELSIVLVILGLLVGGVLSGQSLIRAAETRGITADYERYATALTTFRDKYSALPGDMNNATKFWGMVSGATSDDTCAAITTASTGKPTCNGNGDGTINFAASASSRYEELRAWQHLANAGLVEGTYSGVPQSGTDRNAVPGTNVPSGKTRGSGWSLASDNFISQFAANEAFLDVSYGNFLAFGGNTATQNDWMNDPIIKAEEAYSIDKKMDDGMPGTGKVLTFKNARRPDCVMAANDAYALSNTNGNACNLFFTTSF